MWWRHIYPSWQHLRTWGNSRLVKTSYFWLLITPVAAKALAPIAGEQTFTVLSAPLTVHIGLPFRWTLFFFMALAFTVGQAIYALACPSIVKEFGNYQDYQAQHPGVQVLKNHVDHATSRKHRGSYAERIDRMLMGLKFSNIAPEVRADLFDMVCLEREYDHPGWRIISAAGFFFGLALFVVLLAQNIRFVIDAI